MSATHVLGGLAIWAGMVLPGQAASLSAADLQGTWCLHEIEGYGQVLDEKVDIQFAPNGSYVWIEHGFQQKGQWRLVDGTLEMSQLGQHEILSASSYGLHLRHLGSHMKLSRGPCSTERLSSQDRVAFHNAASMGDLPVVAEYLDRGMPIDVQDHAHGDTALIKAAKFCRLEVSRLLLQRGAQAQRTNAEGKVALDYALASSFHPACPEMVRLLSAQF